MRRFIIKSLVVFFFFLLLIILKQNTAFAGYTIDQEFDGGTQKDEEPTSATEYINQIIKDSDGNTNWKTLFNENTQTVWVTFNNLALSEYRVCLKNDPEECKNDDSEFEEDKQKTNNKTLKLALCPAGKDTLKLDEDQPDGSCSENDYFWGQHTYQVSLHDPKHDDDIIATARFYIAHYYPEVQINSDFRIGSTVSITINGLRRKKDSDRRNNYVLELVRQSDPGNLIREQDCLQSGSTSNKFTDLEEGDYLLKINEQVDEKGIKFWDGCQAGFTYYYVRFTIRPEGGKMDAPQPDPAGRDIQGINKTYKVPLPPCAEKIEHATDGCKKVNTGIGIAIETTPAGFVKSVFSIVLGLAGGLAILLIIYSGYQLIESRGNPEKLEAAREQLRSAIIGLLFIIFSLVIIQAIGVDILRIPGFGR